MRSQLQLPWRAGLAALVGGLFVLAACEDDGTIAPMGGSIALTATPSSLTLDPEQGVTSAMSQLIAHVFDADGFPVGGVSVLFTTSGGVLASSNSCVNMACTQSGGSCTTSLQCPLHTLETDVHGRVVDFLTVTCQGECDDVESPVEVIASSGTLNGMVQVTLNIVGVNQAPTARLTIDPEDRQCINEDVIFDAGDSSDPENDPLCYRFQFGSQVRTQTNPVLTEQFTTVQQSLSVELRVSDDPAAVSGCSAGPALSLFNSTPVSDTYQIFNDTTAPTAVIGGSTTGTVGNPVALNGNASTDPAGTGSGIVSFQWACGNGQTPTGASVACTYSSIGPKTVTLTVTDGCGNSHTATTTVTIS